MQGYLGIDVGSVSTDLVVLDPQGKVEAELYLRTHGRPIEVVQEGLNRLTEMLPQEVEIAGAGTTGSGRQLAGVVAGADVVKNEITAHARAAMSMVDGVQTVIEIGGQDSKIIILRDGVVADFAMNTVCAAGTGSFLDQQAARLNVPIEEFGQLALSSSRPVRIAGRCTVFAESDMIHKQQMGHGLPEIIDGLCEALVRNYLANVGKGKEIRQPVSFQGGVAANAGIRAAFNRALGCEVVVPEHFGVMGAIGAALLARDYKKKRPGPSSFRGFGAARREFTASSFECRSCANYCEVVQIRMEKRVVARWGDRCGKYENRLQAG